MKKIGTPSTSEIVGEAYKSSNGTQFPQVGKSNGAEASVNNSSLLSSASFVRTSERHDADTSNRAHIGSAMLDIISFDNQFARHTYPASASSRTG